MPTSWPVGPRNVMSPAKGVDEAVLIQKVSGMRKAIMGRCFIAMAPLEINFLLSLSVCVFVLCNGVGKFTTIA